MPTMAPATQRKSICDLISSSVCHQALPVSDASSRNGSWKHRTTVLYSRSHFTPVRPQSCLEAAGGASRGEALRIERGVPAGGVLALSPDKGDTVSASAGGIAPTLATFEQCRPVLV
jgi:hypothetical protein